MSNAAERVRAYLTARATIYDGGQPGTCTTARNKDTGQVHKLFPADLEALLQTIQTLSDVLARTFENGPPDNAYEKEDRT